MIPFTKRKFLKLEGRQQHKKCAEILRKIYDALLEKKEIKDLFEEYHLLSSWLRMEKFSSENPKKISDRYHEHLKRGNIFLKEHNLLPFIRKGDREAQEGFGKAAIYLDGMRSAYNVGSILRTIEALRIGPVYFHENTPSIDNDKVKKVAMGADRYIPCYPLKSIDKLPRPLIALETAEEGMNISTFIFPESFTLIIGNEEYGISDEVLKMVDYTLEIPLYGAKNSLNAACAFSIAAQEIRRQRNF